VAQGLDHRGVHPLFSQRLQRLDHLAMTLDWIVTCRRQAKREISFGKK
jgi:hypothetical protein